ncbi:MAG: hypothetical protein MZW92_40760 [Comamonadaceae bacterium]|nr:hypothetical protein [Comamonadaceae bacterium]
MMIEEAVVGDSDPWTVCRPLLELGLVEAPNRQAPRSEWLLRVPPLLWDAARGEVREHPAPWCEHRAAGALAGFDALIADPALVERLRKLPGLVEAGIARLLVLRGVHGSNIIDIVGAVAGALGRGLIVVDGGALKDAEDAPFLGALCTMSRCMPLLNYDLAPGESAALPALTGYTGPLAAYLGVEGGLSSQVSEKAVTLHLPTPDATQRPAFWRQALNGRGADDLAQIAERFHRPAAISARLLTLPSPTPASTDARRSSPRTYARRAARSTASCSTRSPIPSRRAARGPTWWRASRPPPSCTSSSSAVVTANSLLRYLGPAFWQRRQPRRARPAHRSERHRQDPGRQDPRRDARHGRLPRRSRRGHQQVHRRDREEPRTGVLSAGRGARRVAAARRRRRAARHSAPM